MSFIKLTELSQTVVFKFVLFPIVILLKILFIYVLRRVLFQPIKLVTHANLQYFLHLLQYNSTQSCSFLIELCRLQFSILATIFYITRNPNMNGIVNSTAIVETNYGLVKGILTLSLLNDVFYSFHGIPYAKPPLDELRFKVIALKLCCRTLFLCYILICLQDPQILEPWSGIWDATHESSPCLHRDQFTEEFIGSEDCLYLNVYTHEVSDP